MDQVSVGVDLVALTRALVDIDSTTGKEAEAGRYLVRYLRDRGYTVVEQPVDGARFNVLATLDPPQLVFSTHVDCVPPFVRSHVEGGRIHGRGACDAKGIVAAQIAAAEWLRDRGERRIGLLVVVGEERGSDGARVANDLAPAGCRFLINGEPTDNRLGAATRGVLRVKLTASGRAAHSSFPELGESAIDSLIDALVALRSVELPSDPLLGSTHYTIGLISGGVAPNVVSPSAEAEVMFRTVGAGSAIERLLEPLSRRVTVEKVLEVPPVRMDPVAGFTTAVFPFTTDIPFLSRWGAPQLIGPGSIHVAHTQDEWVAIADLESARDLYAKLATLLLAN